MNTLPTGNKDDFVGEFEEMNLEELKDKQFLLAVGTGDPTKSQVLGSTISGPFNFIDMVNHVGELFAQNTYTAKVFLAKNNPLSGSTMLDPCVIDFIQAKYEDILFDAVLDGTIDKEYTCKAGFVEVDDLSE